MITGVESMEKRMTLGNIQQLLILLYYIDIYL